MKSLPTRAFVTFLATTVLSVGALASSSQAASNTKPNDGPRVEYVQHTNADRSDFTTDWGWGEVNIYFDRFESNLLAWAGTGSSAAINLINGIPWVGAAITAYAITIRIYLFFGYCAMVHAWLAWGGVQFQVLPTYCP